MPIRRCWAPQWTKCARRGGIFIADEVQPGFARTGASMWGFDRHGVAPEIVTMGKPMGNGIPVAAMAARADVLEAVRRGVPYFNTFGGNPVSIAAASAVLDVIEGEGLMANAATVGEALCVPAGGNRRSAARRRPRGRPLRRRRGGHAIGTPRNPTARKPVDSSMRSGKGRC